MRYAYVPAPMTIYRGIRKLLPGHVLTVDLENLSVGVLPAADAFWNSRAIIEEAHRDLFDGSAQEIAEHLDMLLTHSVGRRLISDVPLGVFLSGGIDSSVIASVAQTVSSNPIKTFTIGFDDSRFDESEQAAAVAAHLGTEHVELTATTEAPPKKDKPDGRQLSEDVKYVRFRDAADTAKLAAFFGLENFPWELLVCRSGADNAMATQQSAKKVVLGTPACAALCERAKQLRLRVVHAGVITFARTSESAGCAVDYRLSQDGVDLVLPFLTKRRVACTRGDFETLLAGGSHGPEACSEKGRAEGAALGAGSVVFVLEDGSARPPACVAWRGLQCDVWVVAGKEDLVVLRSRLG